MRKPYTWRFYFIALILSLCLLGLVCRMLYLAVLDRAFLLKQGNVRVLREVSIPAHRGMITDRYGIPLAISTPMSSVWVNPQVFAASAAEQNALARLLAMPPPVLAQKLNKASNRSFNYLIRNASPVLADEIKKLAIPGIFFQHEYKRYYPKGEMAAHLLGFTNVDDRGQEGMELGFDGWLRGMPGKRKVIKDRLGHIVAALETLVEPQQGHDLVLSIDHRLQYLAYRELERGVIDAKANSGSVVVLDAKTGEALAIANYPSYNPNDRPPLQNDGRYRNRAITDLFEPGSTIKAFTIVSALVSGKYHPGTLVDTNPGRIKLNGNVINDLPHLNNGVISVSQVLQKSSSVGIAKISLSLPPEQLVNFFHKVGFGERVYTQFPGEAMGAIVNYRVWRPFDLATLAFGYGLSVSTLQLAQAYSVLASLGIKYPVTLLKRNQLPPGERVLPEKIGRQVLDMLATVVEVGGTGYQARVPGYRIAGKTGTAYIAGRFGYNKNNYTASFVGVAPFADPRFVVAVVLRKPDVKRHFGGSVSGPIFSKIMEGVLRLYNVPPDAVES
jgi:cell division protein FtsI (penicillin-binding protein 3)